MSEKSEKKPAEGDGAAGKKGKKKLFIIIGAVVAVLLIGGGVGAYMLSKKKAEEAAAAAAAAEADDAEGEKPAKGEKGAKAAKGEKAKAKKKAKKKGGDKKEGEKPVFVEAEPFTVNLADTTESHMAQLKLTLTVENEKVAEEVKGMMPAIRNNILLLLGSKSVADIATRDGKETLAREVVETTNAALEGTAAEDAVSGVLFQNIIVQ